MQATRLLLLAPLAIAVMAPAPDQTRRAQADFETAQAEARRLQAIADRASGDLNRLRASQRSAAGRIEAAEARITLADLRLRQALTEARAQRLAIAEVQRPVASLLAGVATMAEAPPLLALIDRGSVDDLVETRILLDASLPVIEARTRAHAKRLADARQAVARAQAARTELAASRMALEQGRRDFAALEGQLLRRSAEAGTAALEGTDRVLAAGEARQLALGDDRSNNALRAGAQALADGQAIPPRPGSGDGPLFRAPFAYRLPADAPLTQGVGDVDRSGIRARGVTLATARGAALEAPGAGRVRFAGPYRGFDGLVILDHGAGWMTMIVNLSPQVRKGERVALGDPIGRALGPISVELYRNGKPYSAALIAGSSPALSKAREGG